MPKLTNVVIVSSVAALMLGVAYAGPRMTMDTADADGDGFVSLAEFTAAHAEGIERRFQKVDVDGDGLLSDRELRDAAKARKGKRESMRKHHRNPDQIVERLDADNSGGISLAEFEGRRHAPDVDKFHAADVDGNNELDATEMRAFMEERKASHRRGGSTQDTR